MFLLFSEALIFIELIFFEEDFFKLFFNLLINNSGTLLSTINKISFCETNFLRGVDPSKSWPTFMS